MKPLAALHICQESSAQHKVHCGFSHGWRSHLNQPVCSSRCFSYAISIWPDVTFVFFLDQILWNSNKLLKIKSYLPSKIWLHCAQKRCLGTAKKEKYFADLLAPPGRLMNPSWEGQKRQHHITSKSLPQEHRNYFNLETSPSGSQFSKQLPLTETM